MVDRKSPKSLLRKKMAFLAKIAVSCKGGPLGKMTVLADFEDLNEIKANEIIHQLLDDKLPKPGSAKNRTNTAPEKGKTTLLELKNA